MEEASGSNPLEPTFAANGREEQMGHKDLCPEDERSEVLAVQIRSNPCQTECYF